MKAIAAIGSAGCTQRERRRRLAQCVDRLAIALAAEQCTILPAECEALAALCDAHDLPIEAARVRRWIPEQQT